MTMRIAKKLLVRVILLGLVVFEVNLVAVYAQGPDQTEEPVIIPSSGQLNVTFEQLGYKTRKLSGHEARSFFGVHIPGNFQISPSGSYLDLDLDQVPEIPDEPATVEVSLAGKLITILPITESSAASDTVRIDFPDNSLQLGRNSIGFLLDTGATCENPGSSVNIFIDESSTVSFNYQQLPYPIDLGVYPFPFSEDSLLNIPVTIVLPDQPTSNDLSAAATIAAGLGQAAGDSINLAATLASELDPDIRANNHLIIIGRPDNNILLSDLELPLDINEDIIQPGYGILEEIVSPWNDFRVALVVSGLDDEGIGKASIALNRDPHFLGMRGPVAIVVEVGSLLSERTSSNASFTLEGLGYDDQIAYGTLPQRYRFDFVLPLGWRLEEAPFFHLKFTHANILNPSGSVIDIVLNGVPTSSVLLDSENTDNGELTVAFPAHRLKDGRNSLDVTVDMDLVNVNECDGINNKRAWTVISNQSEIFLSYNKDDVQPDLSVFPYPFSQSSGLEPTYFVVPDQPLASTVNHLVQLALHLGRASTTERLAIPVVFASEVDEQIRENNHLIVLGRPTENSLLAEINDELPHPFIPDSDILQPLTIDNVVLLVNPERDAGLLQMVKSPWNTNYSILIVTGTTDAGSELAVEPLILENRNLTGNLAVVESIFDPFSDNPNKISIYAVDTRETQDIDRGVQTFTNILSNNQEISLSEQWWK